MTIPSDALQHVETRTSYYWERPDGTLVQRVKPDATQTLADAKENLAAFERLCGGGKRVILVDMRSKFSTAPGVREYYAGPEAGRLVGGMALLIESSFGRIVGNLYMTLTPPRFPTRMFTAEEDALAWLRRMGRGLGAAQRPPSAAAR